jgi:pyridoxine 4-dehydrogenase
VDLDGLKRALPTGIAGVQNAYSLRSRQYKAMLDLCVEQNIAWVPFFPLGGAQFPGWPRVVDQPVVVEIAERLGVKRSQIGLARLLAHRPNILLIPGTVSRLHLEENTASGSIALDHDVLAELGAIYADEDA